MDAGAVIAALAGVVVAAFGLFGVWLNDRTAMRRVVQESNAKLVDNLQEERIEIKRDLQQLKRQVSALLLQGRYKDDYINMLRAHIELRKPPPAPAYPAGLLNIATEGL